MTDLKGKVAVVTGTASGIGKWALVFAEGLGKCALFFVKCLECL